VLNIPAAVNIRQAVLRRRGDQGFSTLVGFPSYLLGASRKKRRAEVPTKGQRRNGKQMRTATVLSPLFILAIPLFSLMAVQSSQGQAIAPYSIALNGLIVEVKAGLELKVRIVLANLTDKDLILELACCKG
jgi:hypothetical protein